MLESLAPRAPVSTSRARPRLGFAGIGWIGRHRLNAIRAADAGEVAAIYDPAADANACAQREWPSAVCTTRFGELLESPLDGIVIATPNALHASQAIAALESGKAVFCQKPLARTAAEVAAVINAARRADRLLHVDLSYRHHVGMQRIRELVRSGELGTIYAVEGVFHNAYGPDKPWFYDAKLSGGGCLLDLGIHLIDLALWTLDFPHVEHAASHLVSGGAVMPKQAAAVEEYAAAQLSLANGASVQLACSWRAPAGCDAVISLTLYGTKGGARFANVNGSFYDFTAEHFLPDRSRHLLVEPPDEWGGRAAIAWAQQLARDGRYDPAIEHLQLVAETLDQLYGRA